MSWTNFHTHCHFCHGIGKPEDYINEAINQGVETLGFSCHASLPFYTDWTMTEETQKLYPSTIRQLQENYLRQINVKLGLEIDYIPDVMGLDMQQYKESMKLDYTIGSVHYMGCASSGEYLPADASKENFANGIKDVYSGDIRKAVEAYYLMLQDMAKRGGFDILGHFDLIKKNNRGEQFFSEDQKWYRDIVESTLLLISKQDLVVEVNTGGMSRNYIDTTYPSLWILEKCYNLNIPITLNSDAHSPSDVTAWFQGTAESLIKIGFTELHVLEDNGWQTRPFTPEGLLPK
ncbi:MAG TPA: histidinol-phosphatase [Clostridiaceae bacterium]|jgi:histidinol-phosphatase (PHP family)|nr:histidinol-phosphatase [Clostridiaceae bacterium]